MNIAVSKPLDPLRLIASANFRKFREAVPLTQAEASIAAGIPIDNLRRYEQGTSFPDDPVVMLRLGRVYGHTVEDFYNPNPPPPKLDQRPGWLLRTMPGVNDLPPESTARIEKVIEEEMKRVIQIREKKAKKK